MGAADQKVKSSARAAADHPAVQYGARAGYAASGVLHLLLGWLALQLALLRPEGNTDQSGAFAHLLTKPLGMFLAVACLIGFCLLSLWQLLTAFVATEWKKRAKPIGLAIAYAAMASVVGRTLVDHSNSSTAQTSAVTGGLLSNPAGSFLVGLIGLALLAAGGYHVYSGVTKRFLKQLRKNPPDAVIWLGRIGYGLKGIAFLTMGVLFLLAPFTHDATRSTGLDGALRALLDLPFGQFLVAAVAVGFVAFGIYSFARAKYADL